MPNKDGIETLLEVRRSWPGLPILAVSGGGSGLDPDHLLRMARALGADATLQKPFGVAELLEAVRRATAARIVTAGGA